MEYAQLRILLFLRINTVFGVEGETKHKRYFLLVHFFALPKKKKTN
jgi:hypothetical protein